jgi:Ca2+-binding EF-hand superfamily protein
MSGFHLSEETLSQAVDVIFKRYDVEGAGVLGEAEMLRLLRDTHGRLGLGEVSGQQVRGCMDKIDRNHDGKLSRREMKEMIRKMLS